MREVRFARGAQLAFVLFRREDIGTADQVEIVTGMVLCDPVEDFLQANHVNRLYEKRGLKPATTIVSNVVAGFSPRYVRRCVLLRGLAARKLLLFRVFLTGFESFVEPFVGLGDELFLLVCVFAQTDRKST